LLLSLGFEHIIADHSIDDGAGYAGAILPAAAV